ncbi:MAG: HEAT repeat domain-containing protein [Elusimicrobia bacterium]|nr:HEAT repeat domain-containing protein [Elusimicrobiota bacterium]
MRQSLLILAVSLAASEYLFPGRLSETQTRQLAQGIKTQLADLTRKEEAERERYVQATVAIGALVASLDSKTVGGEKVGSAMAELMAEFQRISDEHHKISDALVLKIAVRAHQLQKYKENGSLALEQAEVAEIQDALRHPRTALPPSQPLPLDIVELRRYLDAWWKPARLKGPKEELPSAKPRPARPAPAPPAPELARDAGRGRPKIDPVPALIEQLASSDARQRSLAADALGAHGEAGEPVKRALRQALHDQDGRVRASAVLSLGAVAGSEPATAEELRQALKDKDPEVRFSAQAALQRLAQPR